MVSVTVAEGGGSETVTSWEGDGVQRERDGVQTVSSSDGGDPESVTIADEGTVERSPLLANVDESPMLVRTDE